MNRGILKAVAATLVLAVPTALAAAAPSAARERGAPAPARTSDSSETRAASHRLRYTTWREARSYWSPDTGHATGGRLWAGRHYFFCQTEGVPHTDGQGGYSTWWALTDDDTGNQDVFVSATAFEVAESWKPVEGLPRC